MKLTLAAALLTAITTVGLLGCDNGGNAGGSGGATTQSSGAKKQVAVIAKSTVNAYWGAVEVGARDAAKEFGVELLWTGPDAETNHSQQADMVDNAVNRGVAGVVLAPTNVDALVRPVESAVAKGVPVILIDSTLNSDKPTSVIATDNYAAGRQAGDTLVAAIGGKLKHGGKVIVLKYLEGSGSTDARAKGFIDRIGEEKGLSVAAADYTKGGGSTTDANETADALLRRFSKDNALDVDGIFAVNQPTAIGMLGKLDTFRASGVAIDCPFVGFDAHEVLLAGIRDGRIAALVVQDPKRMGYLGVKTMVALLDGDKVDAKVPTATAVVTKANVDTAEIKAVTLEK